MFETKVNGSEQESTRVRPKVLAVASGGGHWVQLLRIIQPIDGSTFVYVTTIASYRDQVGGARFYAIHDASRWNKFGLLRMAAHILWIILKERPDVVLTTGAAPGYFAVRFGRLLGARTAWIDSIANADTLSMAGQRAGKHADLWLTQWPHLAKPDGPQFKGSVL